MTYSNILELQFDLDDARPDAEFVYGYIEPNQFADERFEGVDLGAIDECLEIEEADALAQSLATRFGMNVSVRYSDEDSRNTETYIFKPKSEAEAA